MARPTKSNPKGAQISPKFTPETINKLEQAFAIDCSIAEACFYADISVETYYTWCEKHAELSERLQRLRLRPILAARQKIVTAITNGPGTADAWQYLIRKRKEEFAELKKNEVTVQEVVTLEDLIDRDNAQDTLTTHRGIAKNPQQTESNSAIPLERGTDVLLEPKDSA